MSPGVKLIRFLASMVLLMIGIILTDDLFTFREYLGVCTMIAAGCISFKTDWSDM